MSEACPRRRGNRARALARKLRSIDDVAGVDVLDPSEGSRAEWTLEVVLTADRVPACVVTALGEQDAAILQAPMRAPGVHQLVAAV